MGSIAIVSAFLAYLAADSTPLAAMFVTVTMIACLRLPALDKPSLAGSLLSAKTFNAINSNLSNFKRLCSARAACIDRNSSATGERIIPIRLSPRWVINLVSALQVLRTIPGHMFDITLVASLASAYLTLNEALEDKDVEDLVKASVELYEETRADYGSTPGTFLANMAAVLERMINLEV
nr:hypothetical protein BaRGS_005134 [Batillaria attramentaria]